MQPSTETTTVTFKAPARIETPCASPMYETDTADEMDTESDLMNYVDETDPQSGSASVSSPKQQDAQGNLTDSLREEIEVLEERLEAQETELSSHEARTKLYNVPWFISFDPFSRDRLMNLINTGIEIHVKEDQQDDWHERYTLSFIKSLMLSEERRANDGVDSRRPFNFHLNKFRSSRAHNVELRKFISSGQEVYPMCALGMLYATNADIKKIEVWKTIGLLLTMAEANETIQNETKDFSAQLVAIKYNSRIFKKIIEVMDANIQLTDLKKEDKRLEYHVQPVVHWKGMSDKLSVKAMFVNSPCLYEEDATKRMRNLLAKSAPRENLNITGQQGSQQNNSVLLRTPNARWSSPRDRFNNQRNEGEQKRYQQQQQQDHFRNY